MSRDLHGYTFLCRLVCSALAIGPLLYRFFATDGDAYHFLALVLLAPLAGIVLTANSLFCLVRYRKLESPWIGVVFILVGASGFLVAWHFIPEFRM